MKCMYCGCLDSKVVDSRLNEDGTSIRRRRECVNCGKRFTTYETVEYTPVMVVKKSGNRQAFDVINNVQKQVYNSLEQEITSAEIGDMVMEELKSLDEVAYVRFASVHRQFKDINTLLNEIESLVQLKETLTSDAKKTKDKK